MNIFESTFKKHKKYLFESLGLNEIRMSREDAIKIFTNFGVTDVENLSPDALKKKYRELATKHHPDMGGKTSDMQDITNAYDVLKNPNYTNTSFTPRRDEPNEPNELNVDFGADVLDEYLYRDRHEHRRLASTIERIIKKVLGDRYIESHINEPSSEYFGVNFTFRGTEQWWWDEGYDKVWDDVSDFLVMHYDTSHEELSTILDMGMTVNN